MSYQSVDIEDYKRRVRHLKAIERLAIMRIEKLLRDLEKGVKN